MSSRPQKKRSTASKKTASKKTASKKTASKKTASKKTASKKTASKKTASKKTPARKRSPRLAPAPAQSAVLVISGPNLDRLGKREPGIYGDETLAEIHDRLHRLAQECGVWTEGRQSNHEGDIVDWIGAAADQGFVGILLNPGAYTHTSVAIYDAIRGAMLPTVEIHLSNPDARESFRKRSFVAPACVGRVAGFGGDSYLLGLRGLLAILPDS
jgi:3-dehydroquinate dehydratase II